VLGGYLLVDPAVDDAEPVSPWAIAPIALVTIGFFAFMIPAALRAQREPSKLAADNLLGAEGVAATDIDPAGIAHVRGETWSVETAGAPVSKNEPIRVVATEGVRLKVEPVADDRVSGKQGG
jgi:membrane-bound serine protease (ClpP class)